MCVDQITLVWRTTCQQVLNKYYIPNSWYEKESCMKLSQCVNVDESIKVVLVALLSYI